VPLRLPITRPSPAHARRPRRASFVSCPEPRAPAWVMRMAVARFDRVERGLIAAVRDVDVIPILFIRRTVGASEIGEAAVALLAKTRPARSTRCTWIPITRTPSRRGHRPIDVVFDHRGALQRRDEPAPSGWLRTIEIGLGLGAVEKVWCAMSESRCRDRQNVIQRQPPCRRGTPRGQRRGPPRQAPIAGHVRRSRAYS